MARLPKLQEILGLSNTGLGTLLFLSAAGAILAMPLTGWLTTRLGTKVITGSTAFLFCCTVSLIPLFDDFLYAGACFFAYGLFSGSMDVAMNGQAIVVERNWGKPIMSSFHAIFSVGMALGAGSGALFSGMSSPLSVHLAAVSLAGLIAVAWAYFHLISDAPVASDGQKKARALSPQAAKSILPLAIIAFCGMTGEGSMADWSALFMNKVVGKSEAFSALAFGMFGGAMTIGRIFGDHFTQALGKKRLLLIDGILAASGLAIALLFVSAWATFLGFFLVGLGLATVVPIIYSTAGNTEGVSPSVGIAFATTIGYSGFFIGPPAIGFLADLYGLRMALCFTLGLFLLMLFLTTRLKT